MLVGVRDKTVHQAQSTFPLMQVTREFKAGVIKPQNLIKPVEFLCRKAWDQGLTVALSFKFSEQEVMDNAWRPHIEQLAWHLKNNNLTGQTIIIIWHEPEDDATDSFLSKNKTFRNGAHFVNYFNRVHGWLKNIDSTIVTSHASLGYAYRPARGGKKDNSAYVSDPMEWVTDADIHSIDIYSGRSFPLDHTLNVSPAFKRWRESRPIGRPWAVSERGWQADATRSEARAESIRAEFDWLVGLPASHRPTYYIVWNTEGVENETDLILDQAAIDEVNNGYARLVANPEPPTTEEPPSEDGTTVECPLCKGSGRIEKGGTITVIKDR